ncbi:MAG: excinuclease ABC subunit B, partial [Nitrospirae bacterium]
KKRIHDLDYRVAEADYAELASVAEEEACYASGGDLETRIVELENEMKAAAKALEFERAAQLRDTIRALRRKLLAVAG